MTPLEIVMAIELSVSDTYALPVSKAHAEAYDKFLAKGWVVMGKPTEALKVFVKALQAVPDPVQRWVVPGFEEKTHER